MQRFEHDTRRQRRESRAVAALLVLTGAGFAALSWRIGLGEAGQPGAGLLAFIAAVALTLLAGAAFVVPAPESEMPAGAPAPRRLAIYLLVALLLCALPAYCGSLIAFVLCMAVLLHFAERVPLSASLGWGLLLGAGAFAIFRLLLDVPLPDPWVDRLLGY